jgi:hypothetical protein
MLPLGMYLHLQRADKSQTIVLQVLVYMSPKGFDFNAQNSFMLKKK